MCYPLTGGLHLTGPGDPPVCRPGASGTPWAMTDAPHEIDPNALAVDSLPDSLRTGMHYQDETAAGQLTTGDIALTGGESAAGDTAEAATRSASAAPEDGDTTLTARRADELMDPPGPPSPS